MPDPLAPIAPGQVSPLLTSSASVNAVLEQARRVRGAAGGLAGPVPRADGPLGSAVRVLVRNDTGADLPARRVLRIGDPVLDASDYPHEVRRTPAFSGEAPTAADDVFAITEGPIKDGEYGRATVLGVAVVDLNVTDAAHTHAAPAAGVTATLATGTSGAAVILQKESGTGTKRAVVLIDSVAPPEARWYGMGSDYAITTSLASIGISVVIPAGDWQLTGLWQVHSLTSAGNSSVTVDLFNSTHGVQLRGSNAFLGPTADYHSLTIALNRTVSFSQDTTVQMRAVRDNIATYTSATIRAAGSELTAVRVRKAAGFS